MLGSRKDIIGREAEALEQRLRELTGVALLHGYSSRIVHRAREIPEDQTTKTMELGRQHLRNIAAAEGYKMSEP